MDNKYSLLTSYRFEVLIKKRKIGFRSISGIKLSAAFEPLAVGGSNSGPAMLPVPVKDAGRLVMERGVSSLNALADFIPGAKIADEMQISIINNKNKPSVTYSVLAPILESVELSKLDALESTVLIESFTVFHYGISLL